MGQVAHALLTRPPLTYTSVSQCKHLLLLCKSVRLACVRHAASVHPEPGSNSHVCSLSSLFSLFLASSFVSGLLFLVEFLQTLISRFQVLLFFFSEIPTPSASFRFLSFASFSLHTASLHCTSRRSDPCPLPGFGVLLWLPSGQVSLAFFVEFSGSHYCLFVKVQFRHPRNTLLCVCLLSSSATLIEYHIFPALSTTFLNFF